MRLSWRLYYPNPRNDSERNTWDKAEYFGYRIFKPSCLNSPCLYSIEDTLLVLKQVQMLPKRRRGVFLPGREYEEKDTIVKGRT
jgi:hypothetical protein